MSERKWSVMITGGAGYVGSRLVPQLLADGHKVTVLDLYLYGDVFKDLPDRSNLTEVKGDIRNIADVKRALQGCNAVIHLACISNDPSFDLDPDLGKSINFDCFQPMVRAAKEIGVERFIYASSSSVYGIKEEENVTENLSLQPLTDYSKFKAMCEEVLDAEATADFTVLTIRPATVCGYGRRLRLDLSVNILTNHAITNRKIRVFGGSQKRPNIHIDDMVDVYRLALRSDAKAIHRGIYNAGYENHTIMQIAEMVRDTIGQDVEIETTPTNDLRSYHISSEKIRRELGFVPQHSIADAVSGLKAAFDKGLVPNSMTDPLYYNIKLMQDINLK